MIKFYCKFCNKEYPTIDAALTCPCNKKTEWNNPGIKRKLLNRLTPKPPRIPLDTETRRHRTTIRNIKNTHLKVARIEENEN